jgi:hypothetical protein
MGKQLENLLKKRAHPALKVHYQKLQGDYCLTCFLKARHNKTQPVTSLSFSKFPFYRISFFGILVFLFANLELFVFRRAL